MFEFSSKLFKLLRFPDVTSEPDKEVGGDEEGDPGEPTVLNSFNSNNYTNSINDTKNNNNSTNKNVKMLVYDIYQN